MYARWHQRDQLDPVNKWLRAEVDTAVEGLGLNRMTGLGS